MTPKLTALRYVPWEKRGATPQARQAGKGPVVSCQPCSLASPLLQEEIRIDSTTVFVDPYEEADVQVRRAQLPHREGLRGGLSSPRGLGPATSLLHHRLLRSGRRHSSRRQPQRAQ